MSNDSNEIGTIGFGNIFFIENEIASNVKMFYNNFLLNSSEL